MDDWKDDQWTRSRKITDEQIAQMRELRSQGLTFRQVADAVGVCTYSAYKYCRDIDVNGHRKLTKTQIDQIRSLRVGGATYDAIAAEMSITRQTAARHCKDIRRGVHHPHREEMRRLRGEGWSIAKIAKKFHRDRDYVRQQCAGIAGPSRKSPLADQVRRLYAEGLYPEQIAERLDCKLHRVYAYMPKADGASPETRRMVELRSMGWTFGQIADALGTTTGRVEWRLAGT